MSNEYDSDGPNRYERIVRERIERLENVLDEIERQGAYVNVSIDARRELVSAIVSCHRVLSVLEDATVLDEGDIPDIQPIRDRLNRQTQVRTASNRRGGGSAYETRPAVDELNLRELEAVARQLEAAANKLNFWATAPDTTDHDEIGHGDLRHLVATRGQEEALDKLPGGDP